MLELVAFLCVALGIPIMLLMLGSLNGDVVGLIGAGPVLWLICFVGWWLLGIWVPFAITALIAVAVIGMRKEAKKAQEQSKQVKPATSPAPAYSGNNEIWTGPQSAKRPELLRAESVVPSAPKSTQQIIEAEKAFYARKAAEAQKDAASSDVTFWVAAKTDPGEFRKVTVTQGGRMVMCDCNGFDGIICSHIDATLIAGERAMVHPKDRSKADAAQAMVAGRLYVPGCWKGSWRRETAWRGLEAPQRRGRNPRNSGRPLVCFTGATRGKKRAEWIAEARAAGWDTVDDPSPYTDVLVAADPSKSSAKLAMARRYDVPVVSYDEWGGIEVDGVLPR